MSSPAYLLSLAEQIHLAAVNLVERFSLLRYTYTHTHFYYFIGGLGLIVNLAGNQHEGFSTWLLSSRFLSVFVCAICQDFITFCQQTMQLNQNMARLREV